MKRIGAYHGAARLCVGGTHPPFKEVGNGGRGNKVGDLGLAIAGFIDYEASSAAIQSMQKKFICCDSCHVQLLFCTDDEEGACVYPFPYRESENGDSYRHNLDGIFELILGWSVAFMTCTAWHAGLLGLLPGSSG